MGHLIAFIVSSLVVSSLFYLIMGLIKTDIPLPPSPTEMVAVNIEQVRKPGEAPKKQSKPAPLPEPELVSELNPQLMSLQSSELTVSLAPAQIQLAAQALPKMKQNWIQPSLASAQVDADGLAKELAGQSKTLRTVTPISTRQPQIPKVAWDNQINGWVLVSFTVTAKGLVKDIRILDAHPRGIFEEEAVATVKLWLFDAVPGPNRHLSQKIEFDWQNYPYNWN